MTVRRLAAADRVAAPWKNGGGLTWEIAADPPGAGLDDFGWRISMARVASAGPFSTFSGVDRIITILEGALDLRLEGQGSRILDPASDPFAFAGDDPCWGGPVEGAVLDLNVMTRRGRFRAEVRRLNGREPIRRDGDTLILFALDEATIDGLTLKPHDAVIVDADVRITVEGSWPRLVAIALMSVG